MPAGFIDNLQPVKSGYKRNFYVVRYHEGVAEKLPAVLDNNEIVFKSGKFSAYAVAYTDTKITTGGSTSGGSNTGTSNKPNGGSSSNAGSSSNSGSSSSNNSNNGSNNNSNSNPSAGVGAPDTGVATSLGNGGAMVTIAGVIVVLAITSGVYAYKVASKKQGREK